MKLNPVSCDSVFACTLHIFPCQPHMKDETFGSLV